VLNLGTGELMVIALVALVVVGPKRLPELARNAGRAMAEVRRMTAGFQQELNQAASVAQHPMELLHPSEQPTPARRTRPLQASDALSSQ
jgi:sec-independent protein translocase protein TatB